MPGEHQRHEQLRGRAAEPDRHDHDHRQEGGDGTVEVDQGREDGDQQHGEDQEAHPVLTGPGDHELPDPGGDARGLEAGADHEQGSDEDDGGVAEAGQGLPKLEHARRPERQSRRHRHDHDRQAVPDEQHHDRADDREGERHVVQVDGPARSWPARWRRGCPDGIGRVGRRALSPPPLTARTAAAAGTRRPAAQSRRGR